MEFFSSFFFFLMVIKNIKESANNLGVSISHADKK